MKAERHQFLRLPGQSSARLSTEQAAWDINSQPHDVPVLVAARRLEPPGNPAHKSVKFFATSKGLELVKDKSWLVKVTNAINGHWCKQNAAKGNGAGSCSLDQRLAQSGQNSG